jgi:uncharacterized SAM-dependent methyltransferase
MSATVKPIDEIKTNQDNTMSDLYVDTLGLFTGKASGNMLPYAYDEKGMELWSKAASNSELPAKKEIPFVSHPKIIQEIVQNLLMIESTPAFIELGCGDPESVRAKTVPLLKAWQKATGKQIEYHAFDISPGMARACAELVASEIENSNVSSHEGDFLRYEGKLPTEGRPSIGIVWGGTMWNASSLPNMRDQFILAGNIDKVSELLGTDARIIQTYYGASASNKDVVLRPYQTEAVRQLIHNILRVIQEKIEPKFNPDNFKIEAIYDTEKQRVSYNAICIKAHTVTFDRFDGLEISFNAGQKLHLASSHKRNTNEIDTMFPQLSHRAIVNQFDQELNVGIVLSRKI